MIGSFGQVFWQLFVQSPLLLAYVAGIVVAFNHFETHPRPAALTLIGAGLLLLTTLVFTLVYGTLFSMIHGFGFSVEATDLFMKGVGLTRSILSAIGIGLLLAAAFTGRGGPAAGRAKEVWERRPE